MSYEPYNDEMYAIDQVGVADELDALMIGTLWLSRNVSILPILFVHICYYYALNLHQFCCSLQPRWATGTGRGTYNAYIAALDQLIADRVWWTPYTALDIHSRAPRGLSEICYRDQELWYTRK